MKVLLIADACLDVFLFVNTNRVNPEGAHPLYTEEDRLIVGGMGRNVKRCLEALDISVDAIFPEGQLSEKVRLIDAASGHKYCRIDTDVRHETVDLAILDNIEWSKYDAVVVSDYNKGFIGESTLLEIQYRFGGPKFLDTKKQYIDSFSDFLIKVNYDEYLKILTEVPVNTVVTEGAAGAFIVGPYNTIRVRANRVNAVDTCGAGDVFLAGYVYGYLKENVSNTEELAKAVDYGVQLATESVKVHGVPANGTHVFYPTN